jgi:hypothetical protein
MAKHFSHIFNELDLSENKTRARLDKALFD